MDWKQSIIKSFALRSAAHRARPFFRDGATEEKISEVEKTLGLRLPNSLRSLLIQTDGVSEELEVSPEQWVETSIVIYSVEQLLEVNRFHQDNPLYRERCISRYCLIATAGIDGIQFGVDATKERREDAPVIAWYPDETAEKPMGENLLQFLHKWCSSKSSV